MSISIFTLVILGLFKVARVTGLDPAKPMFEAATEKGRIDK